MIARVCAQGATILHVQYITPLLHKHENVIDLALEEGMKKVRMHRSHWPRQPRRHCCSAVQAHALIRPTARIFTVYRARRRSSSSRSAARATSGCA
jgi:hypothetical protein